MMVKDYNVLAFVREVTALVLATAAATPVLPEICCFSISSISEGREA